jgi:REP element-mobilizing transposase RayT
MARRLRVEYEGALYHVINRGNYRSPIFDDDRTKRAFMRCLFEACGRAGWSLCAFVVMRNHFHIAIKTPRPNLSTGMHWLQSTFSTRFNRFRHESGHVFQGRFKAILVESEAELANVAHYIHLNPVRANIAMVDRLHEYPYSSYVWFRSSGRASFLNSRVCLNGAGGLSDTRAGWRSYAHYLGWLAASEAEQKRLSFEKMSDSWALGSAQFKRELATDLSDRLTNSATARDLAEAKQVLCETLLDRALCRLGRNAADIHRDKKSADWKVAIAAHLKSSSQRKTRGLQPNSTWAIPTQ